MTANLVARGGGGGLLGRHRYPPQKVTFAFHFGVPCTCGRVSVRVVDPAVATGRASGTRREVGEGVVAYLLGGGVDGITVQRTSGPRARAPRGRRRGRGGGGQYPVRPPGGLNVAEEFTSGVPGQAIRYAASRASGWPRFEGARTRPAHDTDATPAGVVGVALPGPAPRAASRCRAV